MGLRQTAADNLPQDEPSRLPRESDEEIDALYERAYRGVDDPLGGEFEGWAKEGSFDEHTGKS